jgi:hypothetical protein
LQHYLGHIDLWFHGQISSPRLRLQHIKKIFLVTRASCAALPASHRPMVHTFPNSPHDSLHLCLQYQLSISCNFRNVDGCSHLHTFFCDGSHFSKFIFAFFTTLPFTPTLYLFYYSTHRWWLTLVGGGSHFSKFNFAFPTTLPLTPTLYLLFFSRCTWWLTLPHIFWWRLMLFQIRFCIPYNFAFDTNYLSLVLFEL